MKRLFLSATLICCFLIANAQKNDFRKANWGYTKAQILISEKTKPKYNEGGIFAWTVEVGGLPAIASYSLDKDRLISAAYFFRIENINDNKYLVDFKTIKKILTDIYGTPIADEEDWSDDLYQDDLNNIGVALKLEHVKFLTKWETERSVIGLLLYSTEGKIKLSCSYQAKASLAKIEEERKEKLKEGF